MATHDCDQVSTEYQMESPRDFLSYYDFDKTEGDREPPEEAWDIYDACACCGRLSHRISSRHGRWVRTYDPWRRQYITMRACRPDCVDALRARARKLHELYESQQPTATE